MISRRAAWLAGLLGVVLMGLGLVTQVLTVAAPGAAHDPWSIANAGLNATFPLTFGGIGVLIVIVGRQRRNPIGWLLIVIGFSLALIGVLQGYWYWQQTAGTTLAPTPGTLFFVWLVGWDWWFLIGPLMLIVLLFPNGRLPSPRWRGVVVALAVCFATFLVFATLATTLTDPNTGRSLSNPLGVLPDSLLNNLFIPLAAPIALTVAGCVAAIFVRFRRAGPIEREQIKWFLFACALFLLVFVGGFIQNTTGTNAYSIVFDVAILAIPMSIGMAILRYRLWDIDVLIRRTLVYAVLTGVLALAYFGSVVVLQNIFGVLAGQG